MFFLLVFHPLEFKPSARFEGNRASHRSPVAPPRTIGSNACPRVDCVVRGNVLFPKGFLTLFAPTHLPRDPPGCFSSLKARPGGRSPYGSGSARLSAWNSVRLGDTFPPSRFFHPYFRAVFPIPVARGSCESSVDVLCGRFLQLLSEGDGHSLPRGSAFVRERLWKFPRTHINCFNLRKNSGGIRPTPYHRLSY